MLHLYCVEGILHLGNSSCRFAHEFIWTDLELKRLVISGNREVLAQQIFVKTTHRLENGQRCLLCQMLT